MACLSFIVLVGFVAFALGLICAGMLQMANQR